MSGNGASDGPATSFRLEEERMPDGRRILYYSWPDEPEAEPGEGRRQAEPAQQPWTPEAGPADAREDV